MACKSQADQPITPSAARPPRPGTSSRESTARPAFCIDRRDHVRQRRRGQLYRHRCQRVPSRSPTTGDGVEINGAFDNTIGGTADGPINVISGNTGDGVEITRLRGATGNVVAGDYIGTDMTGTVAIANGNDGVEIDSGASGNTIGGLTSTPGTGRATSSAATPTTASRSPVRAPLATLSRGTSSALMRQARSRWATAPTASRSTQAPRATSIGGTTAAARNVISANEAFGVLISAANDNVVEGDYVGTDVTGSVALGNNLGNVGGFGGAGIGIESGSSGNTVGGITTTPGTGAGNLISGNFYSGVLIVYAPDNLVAGNLIGTDVTGTLALGNDTNRPFPGGGGGVIIEFSPDNIVGELGGRNVISANGNGTVNGDNVEMLYSTGGVVQSNYIGTDITGTVALSTENYFGVALQYGSYTIGGLTPTPGTGLGNVISGNGIAGINYDGYTAPDTVVIEGNIIGADATGEHAVPNGGEGVALNGTSLVTIGGTAAGAGNLISGNNIPAGNITPGTVCNVSLSDSSNNVVEGNLIGTDITGESLLTSSGLQTADGVSIDGASTGNTIGGTTAAARNIISGNADGGVFIGVNQVLGCGIRQRRRGQLYRYRRNRHRRDRQRRRWCRHRGRRPG